MLHNTQPDNEILRLECPALARRTASMRGCNINQDTLANGTKQESEVEVQKMLLHETVCEYGMCV